MKIIGIAVLSLALSGCATQSFNINGGGSNEPMKEKMQTFVVFGIGQTQDMDAASICGGAEKVAKVESHLSFLDGLLSGFTFGLYSPRQAAVYCTK
ncbi:Bor family protein [Reinekea sp.]|jgi:hypothetical protein|uniref:Bor family protein n=1 Tax=Reinekea sp. TaxID=1970455 RepID=UPI002A7EB26B|nr:Bor family protein [Reinekea sp.]